jgi:LAO/AO transport system kinase
LTAIVEQILQGQRRAIARQISQIENNQAEARPVLAELYPHTGQAHLVGITGAPGTGKSTLVNELAKIYRRQSQTVAILSIDPTSPFSGGAILGDRIRMKDLAGDPGVFVRSMATRGSLGGLARAAADAIKVFDAAGFQIILIETVGVGQAEVEVARLAHTVIVVDMPGLGDEVQAIKAGLLEIADIFVINKADRQGADRLEAALNMMLDLGSAASTKPILHHEVLMEVAGPILHGAGENTWRPPIYQTIATTGHGVEAVVKGLAEHRAYLVQDGSLAQRERSRMLFELEQLLKERLLAELMRNLSAAYLTQMLDKVVTRQLDPYTAVDLLLASGQAEDAPQASKGFNNG